MTSDEDGRDGPALRFSLSQSFAPVFVGNNCGAVRWRPPSRQHACHPDFRFRTHPRCLAGILLRPEWMRAGRPFTTILEPIHELGLPEPQHLGGKAETGEFARPPSAKHSLARYAEKFGDIPSLEQGGSPERRTASDAGHMASIPERWPASQRFGI